MTKIMVILAIVISYILYWTASNVCKYNFVLEKKTKIVNIISNEVKPSLGLATIYYYKELNCNNVKFDFTYQRLIDNLQTLSVMAYQSLTTDIKGDPN
tara:strand:- start:179 stop:472 length:294 start_codon:yes stop_codon:yes gene_type:complete